MTTPTSPRPVDPPTTQDLDAAWRVVSDHLRPTPLVVEPGDRHPALKLETFQPTGSFKVRGSLAALAAAPADARVVTASAGNHGLGMTYAARVLGRRATVVVAETASPAKVARLRELGADLVQFGPSFDEAEAHALELAEGGLFVSPYNDPQVIAGQSTIGRELDSQLDLSGDRPVTVVCAVGGGGLAAGLCLWAADRPGVRVVGVEVSASLSVSAAMAAGRQVDVELGTTIADGIYGNIEAGSVTPAILSEHADAVLTVDDDEIRAAMRYLALDRGVVAEGAGAAATAAVLAGKVDAPGQVLAVVSGRNVTAEVLASAL